MNDFQQVTYENNVFACIRPARSDTLAICKAYVVNLQPSIRRHKSVPSTRITSTRSTYGRRWSFVFPVAAIVASWACTHAVLDIEWDQKYLLCSTREPRARQSGTGGEFEHHCEYDYCDPDLTPPTLCKYTDYHIYFEDYGEVGQDCRSFQFLEGYILEDHIPGKTYLDTWCELAVIEHEERR